MKKLEPADYTQAEIDRAIENCALEPIHIPGSTQAFGALFACDIFCKEILYVTENINQYLGIAAEDVLGNSVEKILGRELVHSLKNAVAQSTARSQREFAGTHTRNQKIFSLYANLNFDDLIVVELEESCIDDESRKNPVDVARTFLAKAGARPQVINLLDTAAAGLKALTGYERVKVYKFAKDGSGEVISEVKDAEVPSFKGLWFPSTDIPEQVRKLMVSSTIRIITDVEQPPVKILAKQATPLDLSHAHLRGISEVHKTYLRNMDVRATLTISVVVDGMLWGLFACHDSGPKMISSSVRVAVELFGKMVSLLVKEKLATSLMLCRKRVLEFCNDVAGGADAPIEPLSSLPQHFSALRRFIPSDGIALLKDGKILTEGRCLAQESLNNVIDSAARKSRLEVDSVEELSEKEGIDQEGQSNIGGYLAVEILASTPISLIFFRVRKKQAIRWAGAPSKSIEKGEAGLRLTPRASFAEFLEISGNRCEPWSETDIQQAEALGEQLSRLIARSEGFELLRHKELLSHRRQQDLLIAELNHRVKNILALVRSLSRQTSRSVASVQSYAEALESRISALSYAHDLAVSDSESGVSLRVLIEAELGPYLGEGKPCVVISGPEVGLRADVAPMIALVLHETITNAAKYGALSLESGVVHVAWNLVDGGLHFLWREFGGPEVVAPAESGFGKTLVENTIPYEFDGTTELRFKTTGVELEFTLPAATLMEPGERKKPGLVGTVGRIEKIFDEKKVLVVEDNMVLAMDMLETLSRLGASEIETASCTDSALTILSKSNFDFAVLDLNLRGVVSFSVAEVLVRKNIPFIFVTGYGSQIEVPSQLRHITILTKPVSDNKLAAVLKQLVPA